MTKSGQWPRADAGTWPSPDVAPIRPSARSIGGVPVWVATLQDWTRAEIRHFQILVWAPIAFAAGIAGYFAADQEPNLYAVVVFAATGCVFAFGLRRHRVFPIVFIGAALLAGFAVATIKTSRVTHTVLTRAVYVSSLKGFVETREERERTDRFVLRVEAAEDLPQAGIRRVRLSVKKGTAPPVGAFVELKARLLPPLSPMRPGGYDFSRDLYFQDISASGFVMGAVTLLGAHGHGGLALRYAALMQGIRDAVDARIRMVLDGDRRAIATALLTGRRDAISTPVNDAMFVSGLGHVLSISGYHMAVVAGVVFFTVRALLALIPIFTVTFPIKKWAAAAALLASTFYLLLSGAEVATQRSFVMTAVVLVAVMVDRRAVTFRTLAIAALIVLAIAPEALVHPSFQMSFAATLGLVALVQIGMPKLFTAPENSRVARVALWGGREIVVLALASLVAGFATMPYAAFHFHRLAPYGVLANLAAMPVVSGVVMPAGLLGLLAMPFGLDGIFWQVMDQGIAWMVTVAQWVAALPGATGQMAAFGLGPLVIVTMGIVVLGLFRTPLRWAGAGLAVVAAIWAWSTPRPDILIADDGRNVAVRGDDGRLHLMRAAKDAFVTREWLSADADPRPITDPSLSDGVSCDDMGCVVRTINGRYVTLVLKPSALADDCRQAAVIVTSWQPPRDCAALIISTDTLRQRGTLALYWERDGFALQAVRPRGWDRPWSPATAVASDTDRRPTRVVRPPPADATPVDADRQADD